jgi:hypothetical protein
MTSQNEYARFDTEILVAIAWRVTPAWERGNWVVTSEDRYDERGNELYTSDQLREFVTEQLAEYGTTAAAINFMRS